MGPVGVGVTPVEIGPTEDGDVTTLRNVVTEDLETFFEHQSDPEAGNVVSWIQRIEALPNYQRTYPPHWRQ